MPRFAGDDPTHIHHLDRDAGFLSELPRRADNLHIVASSVCRGGEGR